MAESSRESKKSSAVGIILTILTMIITIIVAIPDFIALRVKAPYVTFEANTSEITYPPSTDKSKIKELLKNEGIPDATLSLRMKNTGNEPASRVKVSISVSGSILVYKTIPAAIDNPPWVNISVVQDPKNSPSLITYELCDMGIGPTIELLVGYQKNHNTDADISIFCDGKKVLSVEEAEKLEQRNRVLFFRAIVVFIIGMLISVFVFISMRIRQQAELRSSAAILIHAFLPFKSLFSLPVLIVRQKYFSQFRNRILEVLLKNPNVTFKSFTEGHLSAKELDDFWDIQIIIHGKSIGIDVHTASQKWDGIVGNKDEQLEFFARIAMMTRKLSLFNNSISEPGFSSRS